MIARKIINLCCVFLFTACSSLDIINERLDKLEADAKDMKTALNNLQKAFDNAKIISNYEPFTDASSSGWLLTFTDNSTIKLTNGEDGADGADGKDGVNGVTPILKIDQDGYWSVSYDNGLTFSRLQNPTGNPVPSQGEEGISVRVAVGESGNYVFEFYRTSSPEIVIDRYLTPISSNPANLISSIQEDNISHTITLTMQNGQVYRFNIRYNTPTSIELLTNKIKIGAGMTVSFEFRVNPSNATFNYDLLSEACELSLDRAGLATRATGYVTDPANYTLTQVEQVYGINGIIKEGQYRAYIKDKGISDHYDELMALVLSVDNGAGEKIQISSSAIEIYYSHTLLSEFKFTMADNPVVLEDIAASIEQNDVSLTTPFITDVTNLIPQFTTTGQQVTVNGVPQTSGVSAQDFSEPVYYTVTSPNGESSTYRVEVKGSGLPVVYINTPGEAAIVSKEDWMSDVNIRIIDTDGSINYSSDELQIRGRGNTTWAYPKKPYALKLKSKSKILGMPKHKRWILLANWMDRTLLRNDIAFQISRKTGLEYTVRGRYVEVVFNGTHIGNYYLCEQIKIDENRVNIAELSTTDISGDNVTGGYLMELDDHFDEVNRFRSSIKNLPYMFKEPDEDGLQPEQFDYMKNFINDMEAALYDDDWLVSRDYVNYMDLDSFIDRWFVQELAGNAEDWAPRSMYMYKDRLGKLTAGPVWDYDYCTFEPYWNQSWLSKVYVYYPRLFEDPNFVALVKTRWELFKPGFATIPAYIRQQANSIRISNDINLRYWPITFSTNGDEHLSFDDAVERLIDYVQTKLAWMDAQIAAM